MKCSVDIPYEQILLAAEAINKKRGICDILPNARFSMPDGEINFKYRSLVCGDRMGGKRTGLAADTCINCVLEKKIAKTRSKNSVKPSKSINKV